MKYKLIPTIKLAIILACFFMVLLLVTGVGTYIYFSRQITSKTLIVNNNNTGVVVQDRTGKTFFTFYEGKQRDIVPLSEISPYLQNAVIAVEDKEFYQHPGISVRGIVRSIITNVKKRDLAFGGSTITQQLVKNALLTPTKSFLRKYQEVILATEIERRFTKKEILEMYLNSVYFGEGAFGAEEASLRYFGKSAKDLNLTEASLLAGLVPAPTIFSPYNGGRKASIERQRLVLKSMLSLNMISKDEYEKSLLTPLVLKYINPEMNNNAPHFAIMVKDFLIKKFGEEKITRSGFIVKTTLDLQLQEYAEKVVADNVALLTSNNVSNAAAVVMEPQNREVLALVGSTDWSNSSFGKVNMAEWPRQPGSSFKPIVYATAFETRAITPGTVLKDAPTTFRQNGSPDPEYKPKNYDGKYRGNVLPRRALANSLNIPSVSVMSKVPIQTVLEESKKLGITTLKDPSNYGLSLVLGTGEIPLIEMTNAYATFADYGESQETVIVSEIWDKEGKLIYTPNPAPQQVFSKETSFLISSILSDARARREVFGNALSVNRPAAVKTGTTENYRDAWTIGYTPEVVVGVWVGNNDGSFMDAVAGSLGAAPIWKSLITHYTNGKPVTSFEKPDGLVSLSICSNNGLRAGATSSAQMEFFIKGTEPAGKCNFTARVETLKTTSIPQETPSITPPQEPTLPPQQNSEDDKKNEENEGKKKDKDEE